MSRVATKCAVVLLVALVGVGIAPAPSPGKGGGGGKSPGVIPHNARFRGLSYAEWQAEWWKAAFNLSPAEFGSGQPFDGEKGVVFLAGLFGEGNVVEITIPPGTPLFFPVINVECSVFEPPPFHADDEQSLLALANDLLDDTADRFAVIDGVPVKDLDAFRGESIPFEWGPVPADNIVGAPAGTTSLAADAGYYLMLAPLNVGDHTIHYGGTFVGELSGTGTIDTTYIIHVVPAAR